MAKLNKNGQIEFDEEEKRLFEPGRHLVPAMETIRENGIVEISDEEIKQGLFGGQFDDQDDDDLSMFFGAKWYREQLKQK